MRTGLLVWSAWIFSLSAGCGGSVAEPDKTTLEEKVRVIFRENCYRCHGEGGSPDADLYVMDHESLLARTIVPGKPDDSRLFRKVMSGDMPLGGEPLSPGSQETLRQWIVTGAADFNPPPARRPFITPQQILEILRADLQQLSEGDRSFARYFSIVPLYNAELNEDRLDTYRGSLSRLVNSLSWQPQIVPLRPIDSSRTLFRIDLRQYRWTAEIWEKIVAADPYGVTFDTPAERFCTTVTGTAQPFVRGDWFVFAASRPPLYHDMLQLPMTVLELESALQVNVSENIRTRAIVRAGITVSQATDQNRLIERHTSPLTRGAYWKTYEFVNSEGNKNLNQHPLGPGGQAASPFDHDGSEIAFQLPNGLQAYLLADARGNRLDAPLAGTLHDRKGRAVVNGVSCMSCHFAGTILTDDMVRQQVDATLNLFTSSEVELVRALYPAREKFAKWQQEDALRFANAVIQTGARLADRDPVAILAQRFEDNLNLKLAAAEVGLPPNKFLTGLEKSPALRRELGQLIGTGGTVSRELFLKSFAAIVRDLALGTPASRSNTP